MRKATPTKQTTRPQKSAQPQEALAFQEPSSKESSTLFTLSSSLKAPELENKTALTKKCLTSLAQLIIEQKQLPPEGPLLHSERLLIHLINASCSAQEGDPFLRHSQTKALNISKRGAQIWALLKFTEDSSRLHLQSELANMLYALAAANNNEIDIKSLARQLQKTIVQQLEQPEVVSTPEQPEQISATSTKIDTSFEIYSGETKPPEEHKLDEKPKLVRYREIDKDTLEVLSDYSPQTTPRKHALDLEYSILEYDPQHESKIFSTPEKVEEDYLLGLTGQDSLSNSPARGGSQQEFINVSPEPQLEALSFEEIQPTQKPPLNYETIEQKSFEFHFKPPALLDEKTQTQQKVKKLLKNPSSYSAKLKNRLFSDTPLNSFFVRLNKSSVDFQGNLSFAQIKNKLLVNFAEQSHNYQNWLATNLPTKKNINKLPLEQQAALHTIKEHEVVNLYADLIMAHLDNPDQIKLDLAAYVSAHKFKDEISLLKIHT